MVARNMNSCQYFLKKLRYERKKTTRIMGTTNKNLMDTILIKYSSAKTNSLWPAIRILFVT